MIKTLRRIHINAEAFFYWPGHAWSIPYRHPETALKVCRQWPRIVRSLRPDRAVVEAQSCGRCGPIVHKKSCPHNGRQLLHKYDNGNSVSRKLALSQFVV